ncbi:MAG: sodium:solute symporter, partial [Clostridiales bacterium]|nr:sodium:solute symporter [Clostridiales bacterium]
MQIITVTALVIFSALMIGVGLYSARKTKTMDAFLLGNRNIGAWMSAFAYGTSYFSAVIFIGYAGKHGWDIGVAAMWIGIGNAILGCLIAWLVLAKRTRNMTHSLNVKTMPEYFEARYGSKNLKILSAIIIFVFLVPYSAAVYKGLGSLFNTIFPSISVNVCMLMVAALTACFLVLGGYIASTYTDFIQGIIMIGGVILMVVIVALNPSVGGIPNMIERLRDVEPSLVHIFGGDKFTFLAWNILLTSFGTWGLPQMISKFYAVKDESAIKRATVVSTVFAGIIGVGAY